MIIKSSRKSNEVIKKSIQTLENASSWLKIILPDTIKDISDKVKHVSSDYTSKNTSKNTSKSTHAGWVNYLFYCWANEKGCCLRPDMIWYRIISETCKIIMGYPNKYRHLFTKNNDKEDIIMVNGNIYEINCDLLDKLLEARVPNKEFRNLIVNTNFKSQPKNFDLAKKICFANMATPYYNFMDTMCDIPMVDLRGTIDEWIELADKVFSLAKFIPDDAYFEKCLETIYDIIYYVFDHQSILTKPVLRKMIIVEDKRKMAGYKCEQIEYTSKEDFFSDMFWIKKVCSSGHPPNVCYGWFNNFYNNRERDLELYPCDLSYVPYKQIDFNKFYYKAIGLTYSVEKDGCMDPQYGSEVHEILDEELFNELANIK